MEREEDFQQRFMRELSTNLDKLVTDMHQRAVAEGNVFESTIPVAVVAIIGYAAKVASEIGIDQKSFVDAASQAHQSAVQHKAQSSAAAAWLGR